MCYCFEFDDSNRLKMIITDDRVMIWRHGNSNSFEFVSLNSQVATFKLKFADFESFEFNYQAFVLQKPLIKLAIEEVIYAKLWTLNEKSHLVECILLECR